MRRATMVTGYEVSPAGDYVAFRENYNAFVMPFFAGAKPIDVGATGIAAADHQGQRRRRPVSALGARRPHPGLEHGPDPLHRRRGDA